MDFRGALGQPICTHGVSMGRPMKFPGSGAFTVDLNGTPTAGSVGVPGCSHGIFCCAFMGLLSADIGLGTYTWFCFR